MAIRQSLRDTLFAKAVRYSVLRVHPQKKETVGVERPNPPVTSWMLPQGGVRLDDSHLPDDWQNDETVRRELMW